MEPEGWGRAGGGVGAAEPEGWGRAGEGGRTSALGPHAVTGPPGESQFSGSGEGDLRHTI